MSLIRGLTILALSYVIYNSQYLVIGFSPSPLHISLFSLHLRTNVFEGEIMQPWYFKNDLIVDFLNLEVQPFFYHTRTVGWPVDHASGLLFVSPTLRKLNPENHSKSWPTDGPTDRSPCLWIKPSKFSLQPWLTVDGHRSWVDRRSVGLVHPWSR